MLNHYCVYILQVSRTGTMYIKLRHPQNKITCHQSDKKSGDVPTQHIIYIVACNTVGSPTGPLKLKPTSLLVLSKLPEYSI